MKILHFFAIISVIAFVSCNSGNQKEDIVLSTEMDSLSYALGVNIATSIKHDPIEGLKTKYLTQGIEDFLIDSAAFLDDAQVKEVLQKFFMKKQQEDMKKQQAEMEKQREASKPLIEEGQKFLDENAKREGITTTASGLQYEVIKKGTGKKPEATDVVSVNYKGTLINGTVFDSNEGKDPVSFPVNRVIAGWTEALKLMTKHGDQIIKANWKSHKILSFLSTIEIQGIDKQGILHKITGLISNDLNVNMRSVSINSVDGVFSGTIDFYIHNVEDLNKMISDIGRLKGVSKVRRIEAI